MSIVATERKLALLREQQIGEGVTITTPFGERLLYYSDFTATGRHIRPIEEWIATVLPYYANSHTVISATGRLMTTLREQARRSVVESIHATDDDVVMFVGSGATAAINKLVGLLWLDRPNPDYAQGSEGLPEAMRPVVIVGPYEHHSNELPWVESIAEVIETRATSEGHVDTDHLESILLSVGPRPLIIGSFSAASNVTGVLTDVAKVARVLHRFGALAFFDFAALGPYGPIDMHPDGDADAAIDALFISTHKFIGGPQSSGILAANKKCFRRPTPERPGGGTVDYVSYSGHHVVDYVRRLDEREEGGTPAIVGDIRAGLAFVVKESLEPERLLAHEIEMAKSARARLARHPKIRLLGPSGGDRLPILSFNIDRLHHDLAAALLDDLFGIQARAGCSCAGPYGHRLLGVTDERSEAFRHWILQGVAGIKPGWMRVTLSPYANAADIDFVLSAVEFIASHGQDLVGDYELDWRDGVWRFIGFEPRPPAVELNADSLFGRAPSSTAPAVGPSEAMLATERARYFVEAESAATRARERSISTPEYRTGVSGIDELMWFRCLHARGWPVA